MTTAYINRIATAVPDHDVHAAFLRFAAMLLDDRRTSALFRRMAGRAGIEHRYSFLAPAADPTAAVDAGAFYPRGDFPDTAARMRAFETHAPALAATAVERLGLAAGRESSITHLLVTCCTGLSAPGLDLEIVERCKLSPKVERTMIGFMGCYAAINALKLSRHIVRSEPAARVLIVNLELCTLHLKETTDIEQMLSFLVFGDGCAACLVSAEPVGAAINSFQALVVPDTRDLITWNIRELGFDMVLSGQVPAAIHDALSASSAEILRGFPTKSIDLWAIHPGGRTVLDAVERAFALAPAALSASRDVLRRYGNMSSATVMFVLEALMRGPRKGSGCAMSFGPGMTAETMLFHVA